MRPLQLVLSIMCSQCYTFMSCALRGCCVRAEAIPGRRVALPHHNQSATTVQETTEHAAQLRQNVADAESRMAALKQDQRTANETYAFFEDMRSFIGVLIDCLDEKVRIQCFRMAVSGASRAATHEAVLMPFRRKKLGFRVVLQ